MNQNYLIPIYSASSIILLLVNVIPLIDSLVYENDPYELLNKCIDARNHKTSPGPADDLHNQCTPWKNRACCTGETSRKAHFENMYNFELNHCSHVKQLSENCKKHFIQDLCFYECSPNTGPWIVKVDMKIRRERWYDVPLCAMDCDNWFEDCKDDFTCTDNWVRNFDWDRMGNKCPVGSSCRTFKEIYQTSENFCERVWDHSWKYTSNDEPCMKLWFNETLGNPNDNVASWKLKKELKTRQIKGSAGLGIKNFYSSSMILILNVLVVLFHF